MASIMTGIQLADNVSTPLMNIISAVNLTIASFEDMHQAVNANVDMTSLDAARDHINQATIAVDELQAAMKDMSASSIVMSQPVIQPSVETPTVSTNVAQPIIRPEVETPTVRANVDQPVIRPGVETPAVSADVIQPIIRPGVETPTISTNMVQPSIQPSVETPTVSANVVQPAIHPSVETPTVGANVVQPIVQPSVETPTVGANVIQPVVQPSVETPTVSANVTQPTIQPNVEIPTVSANVSQPRWQSDNMEVYNSSGIDRFQQEVASANQMLQQLSSTQMQISQQAQATNVFSTDATQDITQLQSRIQEIQQSMERLSSESVHMDTDTANAQMEQLRAQLNQAVGQQETLNSAVRDMDVGAANNAYIQLSRTIGGTERYIRDNVTAQGQFTAEVNHSNMQSGNLISTIKRVAGAYLSVNAAVNMVKDSLRAENVQIEAETKLTTVMQQRMGATDQMIQSVKDLTAAQQSLGVVGDEVQMAGAQQIATFLSNSDALQTLIPAMNNLAVQQNGVAVSGESMKNIANMMGKAMQGQVSALTRVGITMTDTEQKALKNGNEMERAAMLAQIITNNVGNMNEAIASTPQGMMQQLENTWGDMKEVVGGQLYPSVYRLFQTIMNNQPVIEFVLSGVASALSTVMNILTGMISGVALVGNFMADHWSIISPVIYSVAAALAAYVAYVGAANAVDLVSKGIKAASCIAAYAHAAAVGIEVSETTAATAAQMGLNTAMLACPLTWIVVGIVAVIAVFYAAVAAINKFRGTSISATGLIAGAFSVLGAFLLNTFVIPIHNKFAEVANFFGNVFRDPIASIKVLVYDAVLDILGWVDKLASGIESVINKIPGVKVNITGGLDGFYNQIAAAQKNVKDSSGWVEYASKMDYISYQDAASKGYALGKNAAEKVKGAISSKFSIPDMNNYSAAVDASGNAAAIAANTAKTAENTQKAANNTSTSTEDLKYLREIASRDVINRFTTAEIKVKMTNNNSISKDVDVDGVVEHLRKKVEQQMKAAAEGVHV